MKIGLGERGCLSQQETRFWRRIIRRSHHRAFGKVMDAGHVDLRISVQSPMVIDFWFDSPIEHWGKIPVRDLYFRDDVPWTDWKRLIVAMAKSYDSQVPLFCREVQLCNP